MDSAIDKAKAYSQTILAGDDRCTFARDEICEIIIKAYSDGYDEGAYDFSDKITTPNPFCDHFPNPLTSIQAEKLAKQFQDISNICDTNTGASELMEMLLKDMDLPQAQRLPADLSEMVEYWGDKLKFLRLKKNNQIDE